MGSGFFGGGSQGQVVDEQGFYDGPSVTPISQPSPGSPGGSGFFDGPQGTTLDSKGFYDGPSLEQLDPVVVGAFRDEAVAAAAASKASETSAASSAASALDSKANALSSKDSAAGSATSAQGSATAASTSESLAATSEANAASSASSALASKNAAATSATNASTSESNAGTSASNAHTSEVNAAASAAAAAISGAGAVRYDVSQALTSPQKTQALSNMGAQAAGSYQPALGYTPVNKAGDTMAALTVSGELVAGSNYVRFTTSGSGGYIQWTGGLGYNVGGQTIWHAGNVNPVVSLRMVYVGDWYQPIRTSLAEPYGGYAVATGFGNESGGVYGYISAITTRFRAMQYQLAGGSWYNFGTA